MTMPPALPAPSGIPPSNLSAKLTEIIRRAGANATFAAQEFFCDTIRNEHTRRAYLQAVKQLLAWVEKHGGEELAAIAPCHVGKYFEGMAKSTSIATRNQHLSALRHFFDGMVTRHAIVLKPCPLRPRRALHRHRSQKRRRFPSSRHARCSPPLDTTDFIGLRDRAILAILVYTSSRAGAVAKLKRSDFYHGGSERMLHFREKGGKSREIPVRHDLQEVVSAYIDAAGLHDAH